MFGRRHFAWFMLAAALVVTTAGCGGESDSPTQPTQPPPTGPATLQITDLTVGEGAEVVDGKTIVVHFTLWAYDPAGTDSKGEFLTSTAGGAPSSFTLGTTSLIAGFVQGVTGQKVGGKRRLIIPPSLAWGSQGNPPLVLPNEWVVFEIELLSVV